MLMLLLLFWVLRTQISVCSVCVHVGKEKEYSVLQILGRLECGAGFLLFCSICGNFLCLLTYSLFSLLPLKLFFVQPCEIVLIFYFFFFSLITFPLDFYRSLYIFFIHKDFQNIQLS